MAGDHLLVFIKQPYVEEPIGIRVSEGLIVDSDPRLAFAQGHSLMWFKEWLKRRPERGWYIVSEQEIPNSPPIEMVDPQSGTRH